MRLTQLQCISLLIVIYGMEPMHILYCIWHGMKPRILKKKERKGKGRVWHWHARNWIMDKIRNWPLNCHSDSLRPAAFKARELYQIWSPLHPFINWQFDTVLVLVYSFYFYFFWQFLFWFIHSNFSCLCYVTFVFLCGGGGFGVAFAWSNLHFGKAKCLFGLSRLYN